MAQGDRIHRGAPLWHRARHGSIYHLRPWKRDQRGAVLRLESIAACGTSPWTGWADADWYQPAPPGEARLCKKCLAVGL